MMPKTCFLMRPNYQFMSSNWWSPYSSTTISWRTSNSGGLEIWTFSEKVRMTGCEMAKNHIMYLVVVSTAIIARWHKSCVVWSVVRSSEDLHSCEDALVWIRHNQTGVIPDLAYIRSCEVCIWSIHSKDWFSPTDIFGGGARTGHDNISKIHMI